MVDRQAVLARLAIYAHQVRRGLGMADPAPMQDEERLAYPYAVKHSILVHPDHQRSGIGRRLLPALIEACAAAGYDDERGKAAA